MTNPPEEIGQSAYWRGEISLAIAGAGRGWDVGIAFGGLTIKTK